MTSHLTALIGNPVSHSLSPRIHHYWAQQYNVETDYKLLTTPAPRLRQTILHLRKKNVKGFNVTIPHKQTVMEYLDGLDEQAEKIGAVNTVINQQGKFIGSNTDAYGFMENLKKHLRDITPYLENILILGAGGATRAAIIGLKDAGANTITITNRTRETAEKMAKSLSVNTVPWDEKEAALPTATLLINTTSLGMIEKPDLQLNISSLPKESAVHDIVYAPLETPLLKQAKEAGHPVVDGLGMLLYQAQRAFHHWHGILPEVTPELRDHVLEAVSNG